MLIFQGVPNPTESPGSISATSHFRRKMKKLLPHEHPFDHGVSFQRPHPYCLHRSDYKRHGLQLEPSFLQRNCVRGFLLVFHYRWWLIWEVDRLWYVLVRGIQSLCYFFNRHGCYIILVLTRLYVLMQLLLSDKN